MTFFHLTKALVLFQQILFSYTCSSKKTFLKLIQRCLRLVHHRKKSAFVAHRHIHLHHVRDLHDLHVLLRHDKFRNQDHFRHNLGMSLHLHDCVHGLHDLHDFHHLSDSSHRLYRHS